MASRAEIEQALRNADAAGDVDAARALAGALQSLPTADTPQAAPRVMDSPDVVNARNTLSMISGSFGKDRPQAIQADVDKASNQQRVDQRWNEYENLPALAKPAVALNDTVSSLVDGATFGGADVLGSGMKSLMSGKSWDDELASARDQTQAAKDRSGWAGTAAQVAGALIPASAATKAMAPFIAPAGAGASFGARATTLGAMGGLEGAGYGALDAAGHGQDVTEGATIGSLLGTGMGAMSPVITGALSKAAGGAEDLFRGATGMQPRVQPRMTVPELKAAKDQAYQQVDNAGVYIDPSATTQLRKGMQADTTAAGLDPDVHRQAFPAARRFDNRVANNQRPTISDIDTERQLINRDVQDVAGQKQEGAMGSVMRNRIDNWFDSLTSNDVVPGSMPPQQAVGVLKDARALNTRMEKTDDISKAILKGQRRAQSNETSTPDTTIRQNITAMRNSDKATKSFSPEELAQMDKIIEGTGVGNFARTASKKLSSPWAAGIGGGMGAAATGGSPFGMAIGTAAPIGIGKALGKLSERSTYKLADELLAMTASGGPAPTAAKNKAQKIAEASPADIARLLTFLGITPDGNVEPNKK